MIKDLSDKYYWANMYTDVYTFVRTWKPTKGFSLRTIWRYWPKSGM